MIRTLITRKEPQVHFLKCYTSLIGSFDPDEVIFMLYMGHITKLKQLGYRTNYTQQYHMMRMGIGRRIFKKCEERFIKIGLLYKDILPKSVVRYLFDLNHFYSLVETIDAFKCTETARRFCDELLDGPNAMLISDITIELVREWAQKDQTTHGSLYEDDDF